MESRPSSRTDKLQRLFELAATQAGHFTAGQARDVGYSARSLVYHVAAGHLDRVGRGFYRLKGVPEARYEDVIVAWLRFSSRQAVVSHDTALSLYDLAPSRSQEVHLTLPRTKRSRGPNRIPGVSLHTIVVPLRRDEVTRRFGVALTSPARTIVDVASAGGDPSMVVEATARGVAIGLVSRTELRRAANRRSGRVQQLLSRAIEEAPPGA